MASPGCLAKPSRGCESGRPTAARRLGQPLGVALANLRRLAQEPFPSLRKRVYLGRPCVSERGWTRSGTQVRIETDDGGACQDVWCLPRASCDQSKWYLETTEFHCRLSPDGPVWRLTSSGRRRSRRECLVGRPRPLNLRGVGEGNGERTPAGSPPKGACRATDRSRSPVAWSKTRRVAGDLVCFRALPAGEPAEGRAFHARYTTRVRTVSRT